MNIDIKYNNYLTDLISLLQEAILRTFSKKPIDHNKFSYYFQHIYTHMGKLQDSFQQDALKITKLLHRLNNYLQNNKQDKNHQNNQSFNTQQQNLPSSNHKNIQALQMPDKPIERPIIKMNHISKTINHSNQLKSIEELEEQHQFNQIKGGKRRSETANGYRQKKLQNQRPFTGKQAKNRYNSINVDAPSNLLTEEQSQSSFYNTNSLNNQIYEFKEKVKDKLQARKSFYDELLKEKDSYELRGGNNISYNLGTRKGNSKSQRKWIQKITRLL